jgi:DNA-binding transcriptional MerR regulator
VSEDLTIDELARRAGTRTSTVRMYQTKGLLPPPEIRGRVGYYSTGHLARLRVIDRLQQRGFSLAAINELLENWARGASLATVLDPQHELASFGEPTELSQADFAALFPDGHVDPSVVKRAGELGLLAFDPERGTVRVPSRAFVEIGRELAAHQVPPARAVEEFEQLAADARRIAERFVSLFAEYVLASTPAAPADEANLRAATDRFRGMAANAVQELVLQALDDATAQAVARHLDD